jgi:hypothetical protein
LTESSTKPSPYKQLAVLAEDHARLKSLAVDLDRTMAATVALLIQGWESIPEDDRRDLLGLPPLLTGPDGGKIGAWLSKELAE